MIFHRFEQHNVNQIHLWRNIHHLNVFRQGNYIIVDIQANAFVHHMVRNIVGSRL